ncbi:hypothetical protein DVH24_008127 [Malus domestica]|uniref:Uncharacterized protein n=1 Tax=Malus domestica TaxID=3750 RepID=A0A498JL95_MALDO|nr:hypothetical protein DVH24_008127 [Malus domestica]
MRLAGRQSHRGCTIRGRGRQRKRESGRGSKDRLLREREEWGFQCHCCRSLIFFDPISVFFSASHSRSITHPLTHSFTIEMRCSDRIHKSMTHPRVLHLSNCIFKASKLCKWLCHSHVTASMPSFRMGCLNDEYSDVKRDDLLKALWYDLRYQHGRWLAMIRKVTGNKDLYLGHSVSDFSNFICVFSCLKNFLIFLI